LPENYERRENIVADSEKKLKLLDENKNKLAECKDKESYRVVKNEIDSLNAEIESNRIAKETIERQYISGLIKSIATKRRQSADNLAKANACRKVKI
jgi:type I site-specific restriction-modification system R (restriction) subunit